MRNKANADHLNSGGSTLFAQSVKKPKMPQMSRGEMKSKRTALESMTIDLNGCNIKVIKPVHTKDALAVLFDSTMLGAVLKHMRENGFSEPKVQYLKHQGAAGFFRRKQRGFVVVKKDANGIKKFMSAKTLDGALEVQATEAEKHDESDDAEQPYIAAGQDGIDEPLMEDEAESHNEHINAEGHGDTDGHTSAEEGSGEHVGPEGHTSAEESADDDVSGRCVYVCTCGKLDG